MDEGRWVPVKQAAIDFAQDDVSTSTTQCGRMLHIVEMKYDFRFMWKQQNACKVCFIKFRLKRQKSNETTSHCVQCAEDKTFIVFCITIRACQGMTPTCFNVRHNDWKCKMPATASTRIQMSPTAGKRKSNAARNIQEDEKGDEPGDCDDSSGFEDDM